MREPGQFTDGEVLLGRRSHRCWRLPVSEQTLAEVPKEIPMADSQLLPERFNGLFLRLKVSIHLVPVREIVGNRRVNLRKGQRGEVLANLFRSRAIQKGIDYAVQGDAGARETPDSLRGTGRQFWKFLVRIHAKNSNPAREKGKQLR